MVDDFLPAERMYYEKGDTRGLVRLLRSRKEIDETTREFIAAILEGTFKQKRGAKATAFVSRAERSPYRILALKFELTREKKHLAEKNLLDKKNGVEPLPDALGPNEQALANVAKNHKVSPETITRLLSRLTPKKLKP